MIIFLFNKPHKRKYSKELNKTDDRSHVYRPNPLKRWDMNSAIQHRTLKIMWHCVVFEQNHSPAYPAFINLNNGESTIQNQKGIV